MNITRVSQKFTKKCLSIQLIAGLIIPSGAIATPAADCAGAGVEQEIDNVRQVDPTVDAAAHNNIKDDDAERMTEVEVSTPLLYLKMLSDDPFVQAIMGVLGVVGLIVVTRQLYQHVTHDEIL